MRGNAGEDFLMQLQGQKDHGKSLSPDKGSIAQTGASRTNLSLWITEVSFIGILVESSARETYKLLKHEIEP